jgi:hypothetical protein
MILAHGHTSLAPRTVRVPWTLDTSAYALAGRVHLTATLSADPCCP